MTFRGLNGRGVNMTFRGLINRGVNMTYRGLKNRGVYITSTAVAPDITSLSPLMKAAVAPDYNFTIPPDEYCCCP